MNNSRRKQITEAQVLLNQARDLWQQALDLVEQIKDDEEEYYDNMPDNLKDSERGSQARVSSEALSSAYYDLENWDWDAVENYLSEASE